MNIENISQNKVFGGWHKQYCHHSVSTQSPMRFAIYLPPQASPANPVPVLYWLSGLTCTDENFMQKSGAMKVAAELGIAIVAPDTSPRGEDIANDPSYDLGQGAGFYLNATQPPWQNHYQMYDYIYKELPYLIESHFPVTDKKSISGHSMGGHGALVIGLRNQPHYCSISAFSPICHPTQSPWGIKAFEHYLGDDKTHWQEYDSTLLLKKLGTQVPILVDQGSEDAFLASQLATETLIDLVNSHQWPVEVRMQPGYDHSYYFITTFIEQHLEFHAQHLFKA